MIDRRRMLAGGAGLIVPFSGPRAAPAQQVPPAGSLRAMAAARGFEFGCAMSTFELQDPALGAVLAREAALLVPEWQMKRRELEPAPGQYDFSALDRIFAFAATHHLAMRGHPLVWYAVNPPWLTEALSRKANPALITGYVETLMRRYRGRLQSVDVVNEAIAVDGNGLRPSPYLSAFGAEYIDMAFHAAQAADPSALLVYNDYGCVPAGNDRFRATTLRFLDGLLARRVPVQALGIQGHLAAFGPPVDQKKLHAFLGEVQARGLALLVTELDVEDSGGPRDIQSRDRAVADQTRRFLDVVLAASNLRSVLTWGISDRYLDPPDDWKLRLTGWKGRKLPYDAQMRRKPMWDAMAAAFAGRPIAY